MKCDKCKEDVVNLRNIRALGKLYRLCECCDFKFQGVFVRWIDEKEKEVKLENE